jgi:hypothetical protein
MKDLNIYPNKNIVKYMYVVSRKIQCVMQKYIAHCTFLLVTNTYRTFKSNYMYKSIQSVIALFGKVGKKP